MKKLLLVILIIGFSMIGFSQDEHIAPSIQIGLSGIDIQKGNLDPEIISQIISDKQNEIQVRLVKNMFLDKLGLSSGLYYTYIDNVLNTVIYETDNELITKTITENTVNLVFIHFFAEYYLNTLTDTTNLKKWTDLYKDTITGRNIDAYLIDKNKSNIDKSKKYIISFENYPTNLSLSFFKKFKISDICGNSITGFDKPSKSNNVYTNKIGTDFICDFIDLTSEVVRQNETLKELGLLKTFYQNSNNSLNRYLNLSNKKRQYADSIFEDMKLKLDTLTNIIGFLYYIYNQDKLNLDITNNFGILKTAQLDFTVPKKAIKDNLKRIIADTSVTYSEDEKEDINQIAIYLDQISNIDLQGYTTENYSNLLFKTLQISNIVNRHLYKSGQYLDIADALNVIKKQLISKLFEEDAIKNLKDYDNIFLKLLAQLYAFDKTETYSFYFNLLADIGSVFPNDETQNTVNKITNFVATYVDFTRNDKDEPVIDFNVESFLVSLQNTPYNKFRPLELFFTVGLNSAYFIKNPIPVGNETIKNYSFFSEKIGIKLKIRDWAYLNSFNTGETFSYYGYKYKRLKPPKEPLISNFYTVLYGSGILYNLINSGTTPNFNHPLIGAGFGLTFFNNLDLNITYGVPLIPENDFSQSFNYSYINLGFDIKFTEYLMAVNKKRKEKQKQKLIDSSKNK